jgi:hypothetical protein
MVVATGRSAAMVFAAGFQAYFTVHRPQMSNLIRIGRVTCSYSYKLHVTTGYVYSQTYITEYILWMDNLCYPWPSTSLLALSVSADP